MSEQRFSIDNLYDDAENARRMGKYDAAENLYREILKISPEHLASAFALGTILTDQQRWNEAIELYRGILEGRFSAEAKSFALTSLGQICLCQSRVGGAIQVLKQAVSLNSRSLRAKGFLGLAYQKQCRFKEAESVYREALSLDATNAAVFNNLGIVLKVQNKLEEAVDAYQTAIRLDPSAKEFQFNLAQALEAQHKLIEATKVCDQILAANPDYLSAALLRTVCQLPVIYREQAEIEQCRQQYQKHLEEMILYFDDSKSDRPHDSAIAELHINQPYYLPYQGFDDRPLQEQYGGFIHRIMARRYPQWAQSLSLPSLRPEEKIRVGFVSGFFREHSVWKIPLKGWVDNLDRSEFEIFGYHTCAFQDAETVYARKSFDNFVQGPLSVEGWCQKISEDRLHLLIFSEIGMDPVTVQLSCLRLAPIQLTTVGHPVTSGLPTIDYYLSSDLMEPQDADRYYSEKLVRLPNLSIYYSPLEQTPDTVSRQDLGIADTDIMFWCCQSLYKYLPQHDDVFPKISIQLPTARFVFIESGATEITNIFKERLNNAFASYGLASQNHCIFLPQCEPTKFAGIASVADIFLDTIDWSGCNSAFESLVFNLPIVTLPGKFMRGRHSFALLKMMGVEDTIAVDKNSYVKIAVRLGQDLEFRQAISRKIAQKKHHLYQDLTPVKALETLFFQLVNKPLRARQINGESELAQADQFRKVGQDADAIRMYKAVLALCPNHPQALFGLGTLAHKQGNLSAAEQLLIKVVELQPELFQAWFILGNTFQAQGRLLQAIEAYQKVLSLQPDVVPALNNLAYVLQETGDLDGAIASYRKAFELQPSSPEIDVHLSNALFARGDLPQDKCSHYARLNYDIGLIRKAAKDFKSALAYFEQAIVLDSTFAEAYFERGILLRDDQGKLEAAIDSFEQAKQLKTDWETPEQEAALHIEMGRTYQVQKAITSATTAFQKAVSLVNLAYRNHYQPPVLSGDRLIDFSEFIPPPVEFTEVQIGAHTFPAISALPSASSKRPFWSIAIPALNRAEYLPECLASVLSQWTGDDMEIIVLDNGSNPALFNIVQEIGGGIIRYYRFPETVPLQQNWNTLVTLCQGKWIHLLHHDDYVFPEFYTRIQSSLMNAPDSVYAAFTGYENINENRQVVFTQTHNLTHFRGVLKDWIHRIGVSCPLSPPCVVVRREAYESLGGYKPDLLYTCDWEFYKRVASFFDWWFEPGILACYREHWNSLSVQLGLDSQKDSSVGADHRRAIEISESYLPEVLREETTQKSRQFYSNWCLQKAELPLKAEKLESAFSLIQEALRIDSSTQGIETVFHWLTNNKRAASLRTYIAEKLLQERTRSGR